MKKNTKLIILIVIIAILIVGIVFIYNYIDKKNNDKKRHVGPKSSEPYKKKKEVKDGYGDEDDVELKYDDYIVASGYAGAADNVYYTRNNVLYHLKLSTNETTRIAEGVKKLKEGIDVVNAYKGDNFKIITEDDYVNYID